MAYSRLGKFQEQKLTRNIIIFITASIGLIVLLVVFGFKLLVNFSLLVDKLKGNSGKTQTETQKIILPPILDSLPEATFSAQLTISGTADKNNTITIYINDIETKKITADSQGKFAVAKVSLKDGPNKINAKQTDNSGNISQLSDTITVDINQKAPKLEVINPSADMTQSGDANTIQVTGNTDIDCDVTVSNHVAIVKQDGSFVYTYPLNDGDNLISVVATNLAGTTTKIDRHVTYHK
jgi:hypothetical protein